MLRCLPRSGYSRDKRFERQIQGMPRCQATRWLLLGRGSRWSRKSPEAPRPRATGACGELGSGSLPPRRALTCRRHFSSKPCVSRAPSRASIDSADVRDRCESRFGETTNYTPESRTHSTRRLLDSALLDRQAMSFFATDASHLRLRRAIFDAPIAALRGRHDDSIGSCVIWPIPSRARARARRPRCNGASRSEDPFGPKQTSPNHTN